MLKHFPILAKKYRNPEVTQKNRANICNVGLSMMCYTFGKE